MPREFDLNSNIREPYGRGGGVGRGRGVGLGLGVRIGVGVAVAVAVAVAVGVGVGDVCAQKWISIDISGVRRVSYPPDNQMWSVPLVSVAKFRRAVLNGGTGEPVVQVLVPGS